MKTCARCKKEKSKSQFNPDKRARDKLYSWCKDCQNAYNRKRYKDIPQHRQRVLERSKSQYHENPEYEHARKREYYRKNVVSVFNALGNKCARCNEKDKRVLHIDHIQGGGYKHRKELNNSTYKFYKDILESLEKKENKFQLLCANCNWLEAIEKGYRKSIWS